MPDGLGHGATSSCGGLVRRTATGSSVGSAACVGLAALKPPTDFCLGGLGIPDWLFQNETEILLK